MHRIIWPHIGQHVGVNIGGDLDRPFVPVILKAADERLFTIEYLGAQMHFAMQWVVTTSVGTFTLDDKSAPVSLLIEVQRQAGDSNAAAAIRMGLDGHVRKR